MKFTAEEKLIRAKVKLLKTLPFYGVILTYMRMFPIEGVSTLGVDKLGDLYYEPSFIETLPEKELEGVLEHEVLHIMFRHVEQNISRLRNVAQDIKINDILISDDITLPPSGIIPQNHKVTTHGVTIGHIDEKTSNMIYEELLSKVKKDKSSGGGEGGEGGEEGGGEGKGEGFHEHWGKVGPNGSEKDQAVVTENGELSDKWKDIITSAKTATLGRGTLPRHLSKIFEELFDSKINWRVALEEYISKTIVTDSAWVPPSRRALASGIYMPGVIRESFKVLCHLDSSGSMYDLVPKFVGELQTILMSFNIECTLIIGDTELQQEVDLQSFDSTSGVEIKGFGGTSHRWVVQYLNKSYENYDLLISLTDGDSDIKTTCLNLPLPFVLVVDSEIAEAELKPYADKVILIP